MLPNPEVSYFVIIETDPNTAANIRTATFKDPNSLFSLFKAEYDNGMLSFELKDGTTSQDDEIEAAFHNLSKQFPNESFMLQRTCEEPYLPDRVAVFRNGSMPYDRYSRFLEPETALDPVTVDAIVDALKANGMDDAAAFVASMQTDCSPTD